jgi:hypothetical protein
MEPPKTHSLFGRQSYRGLLLLGVLSLFSSLLAQEPSLPTTEGQPQAALTERWQPSAEQLQQWVKQLGVSEFRLREEAARQLSRCDARAIEPLRTAAKNSNDPEVRGRCEAIAATIYELDVGERLRNFLASSDPSADGGFRGWPVFAEMLGGGRAMKRLFTEVARAYPSLADSTFDDQALLLEYSQDIARDAYLKLRSGKEIALAQPVALLLCATRLEEQPPREVDSSLMFLLRTAPYTSWVSQSPYRNGLRKLCGAWLTSKANQVDQLQLMQLALEQELPEILGLAREVLRTSPSQPVPFELAMACLVRFGSAEDRAWLDRWCRDDSVIVTFEDTRMVLQPPRSDSRDPLPNFPVQIAQRYELRFQDVAIAAWMKLGGFESDLAKYFPTLRTHPLRVFQIQTLAFREDDTEGRANAIAAWERLREEPAKP